MEEEALMHERIARVEVLLAESRDKLDELLKLSRQYATEVTRLEGRLKAHEMVAGVVLALVGLGLGLAKLLM